MTCTTQPRQFDLITFDCYGTLIDWEEGISGAFITSAREDGVALDRAAILRTYADVEPVIEAAAYRPYRDVLRDTAVEVARRLGWTIDPRRAGFLPDSIGSWPAFADTNPALERLTRAGHRLGILSNVDDDLLGRTCRHFTVDFDLVVTAEQVRSYKPAHPHFLEARKRLRGARWLHAAQSYFHDVVPAMALGVPVAWVNRHREHPTGTARPIADVQDLATLADWLERKLQSAD